jgi:hypothetical protein
VKYVILCWGIDHIYAWAATSNVTGISLFSGLSMHLLVDCFDVREGYYGEAFMTSFPNDC